jgi:hypothetical protein
MAILYADAFKAAAIGAGAQRLLRMAAEVIHVVC